MRNKIYHILPWTSLGGAVLVIVLLIVSNGMRSEMLTDTGETTRVVNATLAELDKLTPAEKDTPAVLEAVEKLSASKYVAATWLIDANGNIIINQGPSALSGNLQDQAAFTANHFQTPDQASAIYGNIQDRASVDFKHILASIPAGTLTDEESLLLTAASAIQAEGEHNDVYRHQVRAIRNASGKLVAIIGVAYDVSSRVSVPGAAWIATLIAFLIGFALYWLSLPVWTYLDASQSGESAWLWAIFVLLGNIVALTAYLLIKSMPRRQAIS